jgi:DNA-binding response OmpR family regulator
LAIYTLSYPSAQSWARQDIYCFTALITPSGENHMTASNPLALVIEDNECVAEICRIALEQAEFEVELVPDGQMALDRLAIITPALILLDLHLPIVPGQQILRYIRTREQLAKTRVILTSADIPRAKDLQFETDFVLEKPFGFTKLYELVKAIRFSQPSNETPTGQP